jgi:hypothetical protein
MHKNHTIKSFVIDGFEVNGFCHADSFYVPITLSDVEVIQEYCKDLGYQCVVKDQTVKILSGDGKLFGWIKKIREQTNGMNENFIYGFYKGTRFFPKYSVQFNITNRNLRRNLQMNASKRSFGPGHINTHDYLLRMIYGIMDLEPMFIGKATA